MIAIAITPPTPPDPDPPLTDEAVHAADVEQLRKAVERAHQ